MFDRMKNTINKYTNGAFDTAAAKIKPEYYGVHGLASSMALLVFADRKVEDEELEAVSEYLLDMDVIIRKNLIREVSEFFLESIRRLEEGYREGVVEGNIVKGEMLNELSKVRNDREWREEIANTINLVTSGGSVDKAEIKTRSQILQALGKEA